MPISHMIPHPANFIVRNRLLPQDKDYPLDCVHTVNSLCKRSRPFASAEELISGIIDASNECIIDRPKALNPEFDKQSYFVRRSSTDGATLATDFVTRDRGQPAKYHIPLDVIFGIKSIADVIANLKK